VRAGYIYIYIYIYMCVCVCVCVCVCDLLIGKGMFIFLLTYLLFVLANARLLSEIIVS
jgi:hypothetical protein